MKVKEPEGMKMLKEAFRVFDSNGQGSVSRLYIWQECPDITILVWLMSW